MSEEKQARRHNSGVFRIFERGVDTAARNNVTAMGYSISITAAFALLQTSRNDTGISAIFLYAAGRPRVKQHGVPTLIHPSAWKGCSEKFT